MSVPTPPVVYSFSDTSKLSDSLAEYILKAQRESIDKRGRFTVAISGGSLPKTLTALISKSGVKWDKWQVNLFPPSMRLFIALQARLLCRRARRPARS
jgi:6-phosphogluconolactonase